MSPKRLFLPYTAAVFLTASAWAGTIHDPAAGVESDNFSTAIGAFRGTIDPHANAGVYGFYNDTGSIITSLSLHTIINTGLTPDDINSSFTCNSGSANPFFQFCGFNYISDTGSLTINFFGVNPPDDDESGAPDAEIGEQEGIPPVVGECLLHPDSVGCNLVGHFAFVFNNGFLTSGEVTNGWIVDATSLANPKTLLFNGPPSFDAPQFTVAPEPGSLLLLGGGILALGGLSLRVKTPKAGGKSHTRDVRVGLGQV